MRPNSRSYRRRMWLSNRRKRETSCRQHQLFSTPRGLVDQPGAEGKFKRNWAQSGGGDRSQPSRIERTQLSKEVMSHTIMESFGASRGGHPSRITAHSEGEFLFTPFILETQLLDRWKLPMFDNYDVTSNPNNHLHTFSNQMMFYAVSNLIWCKVFLFPNKTCPQMVLRVTPNNIDCFATLKARFNTQFAPFRPATLTLTTLVNVRQDKDESLRSFVDRFNRILVKIKDLSDEIAGYQFSTGL